MLRSDAGTRIENRTAKEGCVQTFSISDAHTTHPVSLCVCMYECMLFTYATVWSVATPYVCININHRTSDKTVTFNVLNAYCLLLPLCNTLKDKSTFDAFRNCAVDETLHSKTTPLFCILHMFAAVTFSYMTVSERFYTHP